MLGIRRTLWLLGVGGLSGIGARVELHFCVQCCAFVCTFALTFAWTFALTFSLTFDVLHPFLVVCVDFCFGFCDDVCVRSCVHLFRGRFSGKRWPLRVLDAGGLSGFGACGSHKHSFLARVRALRLLDVIG